MAGEWKLSKEEASYVKSCEKWVHGICISGNCRDGNEARYTFVDGETGVERRWDPFTIPGSGMNTGSRFQSSEPGGLRAADFTRSRLFSWLLDSGSCSILLP